MSSMPIHNPATTASAYIDTGGRRRGMTTLLVDVALMNARAGAKVRLWSMHWPEASRCARLAYDRLQVTDTAPAGTRFFSPGGVDTVAFPNGGRVEFRGLTNHSNADVDRPGIDFDIYDAGENGKVVRHNANVHHR